MIRHFYCTIVNKTQAKKKSKNAVRVHAMIGSNHKHSRRHGYNDVSLHIEICDLNLQSAVWSPEWLFIRFIIPLSG